MEQRLSHYFALQSLRPCESLPASADGSQMKLEEHDGVLTCELASQVSKFIEEMYIEWETDKKQNSELAGYKGLYGAVSYVAEAEDDPGIAPLGRNVLGFSLLQGTRLDDLAGTTKVEGKA